MPFYSVYLLYNKAVAPDTDRLASWLAPFCIPSHLTSVTHAFSFPFHLSSRISMPPARKLVTHIGTDSCGGQRRHVCPEVGCGASFVKRAHLRRHEMTHTSQRDFICPGCGRAFSRNDSMERHLRRKHFELYRNRTRPKSLPSTHDGTTSIAVDLDRSHLSGTPTDSREDSEDDGPSGYSSELTCTTNQVGNTQIHVGSYLDSLILISKTAR